MQWRLNTSELEKLRDTPFKKWINGSLLSQHDDDNKWCFVIYPKGYLEKHKYMKIYLTAHSFNSQEYKSNNETIKVQIGIECNINNNWNASYNKIIDYNINDQFNQEIDPLIPIEKSQYISTTDIITFDLNIKILAPLNIDNDNDNDDEKSFHFNKNGAMTRTLNIDDVIIYKWAIPEVAMNRFLSTPNGKAYNSPIFEINGNKFQFLIFPSGTSQLYHNSVALYLQLIEWNPMINALTLLYDVHVAELSIDCCGCICFGDPKLNKKKPFNKYSKDEINELKEGLDASYPDPFNATKETDLLTIKPIESRTVWSKYTLQTDQIKSLSTLSMEFYFRPSRMSYNRNYVNYPISTTNNEHHGHNGYIIGWLNVEKPWNMQKNVSFKWHIHSSSYYNAANEKTINSPRFDQWRMRFYPNGFNGTNIGKLQLNLSLIAVCAPISNYCIDFMIRCNELNFIVIKKNVSFSIKHLRFDIHEIEEINTKYLRKFNQLTFECEIKIISLFDKYGNKIILESNKYDQNKKTTDIVNEIKSLSQSELNELRQLLFNNNNDNNDRNINNMNDLNIKNWMQHRVQLNYYDLFINDGWDSLQAIKQMTDKDLIDIGVSKKGHRVKILQQIKKLK